jgi:hypothetical protein
MLVLDTTSKSITAVLSAAPATNQLNYVTTWADNNGTTFTEGAFDGVTNSTTTVTMVASPAASTRRIIKSINIQNTDTVSATVTVGYVNGANTRILAKVTLSAGDTWTTDATFDLNGQIKYIISSINAATQLTNQVPIVNGGTGATTFAGASLVTYSGTETLTNKTLTAPVISSISNTGTLTLPTSTDTLVGRATTDTLTNKRITSRVLPSTANVGTPSINTDLYDIVVITGQSSTITNFSTNLSGTPTNGQKLWISITGTGAIGITTWGTSFESSTVTLPTTTVSTDRLDVGFVWNPATAKWRCVAKA